jgi:type I restriction enzyme R subunit
MSKKLSEYRFEEWIEKSLISNGYSSGQSEQYNKDLCLIIDDVIGFIKETQQKEYDKLYIQSDHTRNRLG